MNESSQYFFAGTGFTCDQNRTVTGRNPARELGQAARRFRNSDHVAVAWQCKCALARSNSVVAAVLSYRLCLLVNGLAHLRVVA